MKALGTVADLSEEAARRATRLAAAQQRHPAGRSRLTLAQLAHTPTLQDPAGAITQVARSWERIHRDLTSGPGALTDDQADEALQVMAAGLVHPVARPGLVLTWCQLLLAVQRFDQVRDSDLEPLDIGCTSYAAAVEKASDELDWQLFPLIHGLPARDACTECVRTCESVNRWQPRVGCSKHTRAL